MPSRRVVVVLPTYNEADNIVPVLDALLDVADERARAGDRVDVLVVDDESPDGTAERVRQRGAQEPRVHLLSGSRRGLGNAYTRGIDHAIAALHADVVVQMDADLSHDPRDVPRLLAALADADVAIGSRYVPGGRIDAHWHWLRRLLSRGGNLFARYVAGIYRVRDCTSGFKALRADALARALPLRFGVQGYVFQVALLQHLRISGARIVELPIAFTDRAHGQTKLGLRDVLEFFLHVWWLRLLSRKTFVKFALTGLSGVAVNLGTFAALLALGVNRYLASAIAIELSIVSNFMLNNYWTFRDRHVVDRTRIRGLKFNLVSLVTLAVSFATFAGLQAFAPGPALLHQAASIVPASLANYFANSYWTFRSRA